MTENPAVTEPADEALMRKGSTLGVVALLCSVLGVTGCLLISALGVFGVPEAIFGMPLAAIVSLTGFVLGVLAFFRAERGTPRGGAISATFLGAIGGALQGGLVIGMLIQFLPIRAQVAPLVEDLIALHITRDTDAAEAMMGEGALKEIDGETVFAFLDRVQSETGGVTGVRIELATLTRTARTMKAFAPRPDASPSDLSLAKPIELLYDPDQSLLLGVWLDEAALNDDRVLFDDFIAFLPSGELLVLRSNGPAFALAQQFGARTITP